MKYGAYYRLMRFHKPVGIFLLWFPTAWALWLAHQETPPFLLMFYFFAGTVVMRAAGCVMNDIADRHIDKHVQRTHQRPLTTGELSLTEALLLFIGLLFIALIIVLQLPILCFYEAIVALVITILYPFCKRWIEAPQLVLGLAFSMGIPMAYAALGVSMNATMVVLFLLNAAWIVAYDTMYAMVDRKDDLRIGVKSTAVLFGSYERVIILGLQIFFHTMWLYIAYRVANAGFFYALWSVALGVLIYQQYLLSRRQERAYFAAFLSNSWYGLLMWVALWH